MGAQREGKKKLVGWKADEKKVSLEKVPVLHSRLDSPKNTEF